VPRSKPKVVIVGGGFGGLCAAKALKNTRVHVTLIDRNNHHLFQPLLYQVATAGLSPAEIATPIRSVLNKQTNIEILMAEITGIDKTKRLVQTSAASYPYDFLVLATGCQYNYFGQEGWEKFAPSLQSLTDAIRIRRRILTAFEAAEMEPDSQAREKWMTLVLVGGGPTGVEMAGSIAELAHLALASDFHHINPQVARIILLEAGPKILTSFPEILSERALKDLKRLRVEVRTNSHVDSIDENGVIVEGKRIDAKTVIWTAGVKASPAGKWLATKIDRQGRVVVKDDCSVPNHPNIFVIGDTACFLDENKTPLPGLAPVAKQQGDFVGKLIHAQTTGKNLRQTFKYNDKGNLATIGRSAAIAEIGRFKFKGLFAWVIWLLAHIYYLIGFKNRVLVLIQWAWAYITFQKGARLITQADRE